MEAKIQKWGNSYGIRIPISIIKALSLRNGSLVEIDKESEQIIIRPKEKMELNDLIDKINVQNLHSEIDSGAKEGNELW